MKHLATKKCGHGVSAGTLCLLWFMTSCAGNQSQQQQSDAVQTQVTQQLNTAENLQVENSAQGGSNSNYTGVTGNIAPNGANSMSNTGGNAATQAAPLNQAMQAGSANALPLGVGNLPQVNGAGLAATNSSAALPSGDLTTATNAALSPSLKPDSTLPSNAGNSKSNGNGVMAALPRGLLTWVGYNYRKDQRTLDVQLVTSGEPSYRIFQEVNRASQNEIVLRFANTVMRHRIRRDINATEFRSPVAYIRLRSDAVLGYTDVVLTLREPVQPRIVTKKGGVMLSFDIPEHWFAPSAEERPVANAEIVNDETPGLPAIGSSDKPAGVSPRERVAYVPNPGSDVFKDVNEHGQPLVPKSDSSRELIPSSGDNLLQNDHPQGIIELAYTVMGVAQGNFSSDIPASGLNADLLEDVPESSSQAAAASIQGSQAGSSDIMGVAAGSSMATLASKKKAIRLDFRDAPVSQVVRMIAGESGINFIIAPEVGTKKTSISLKNVPWDVALKAVLESNRLGMQEIAPGLVRIDALATFAADKDAEDKARQSTEALIPTKVLIMPLNYAKAEDAAKLVQAMLPKVTDPNNIAQKRNFDRFRAQADSRSNAVIVEATPNVLSTIKTLLERLDSQTPQVRIASRLVEVSNDIADGLGVNWDLPFAYDAGRGLGFGSLPFPNSVSSRFAVDPGGATERGGNAALHFGSINNMLALDLKLRMYETKRKAETLQTQDVVVQDNEKALVTAGSTDFIQTLAGIGGTGGLQAIEYNLALSVVPHITADGAVQMKIDIKGDSPKKSDGAAASKNTRQLQTTLLKRSGETAVIGGLYSSEVSMSQRSVPYLSSIPLIGALFRSTDKADSKKDLLIMVTPTIVGSSTATTAGGAADAESLSPPIAMNAAASNNAAANGQLNAEGQSQNAASQQSGGQAAKVNASQQSNDAM